MDFCGNFIQQLSMALILRICGQRFLSPIDGVIPIFHLAVVFRDGVEQMFSRHPALSIRNLQQFGKIIDGHLVLPGDGVATAAADQAFLIETVNGQCAGIINDGGI